MHMTEILKEGLKRRYRIDISAQELSEKVKQKLIAARSNFEIKGFRKGKAPIFLLKKRYGVRILNESMQEIIDDSVDRHFKKTGDQATNKLNISLLNKTWKEGDDLKVSLDYECFPKIPALDFSAVKVEKYVVKLSDQDIIVALRAIAKNKQNFIFRNPAELAQDGDQVVIDFVGKVDGKIFDGGTAQDYPLILGSNSFIAEFEKQLIGSTLGKDVDVKVKFPANYDNQNLAGKIAIFACKIKQIKSPKAVVLDDELAKKFNLKTLDAFKEQVAEHLTNEFTKASRMIMKRDLLDQLDILLDFSLPMGLVDKEAKHIAYQLWHEKNPNVTDHDHPEIVPDQEHKRLAIRRVRLGLLLNNVGLEQNISVTDSEMQQAIMEKIKDYPGQEKEFIEFIQKTPDAQQQLRTPIFENKVINYIIELAKINKKIVSQEELQKRIKNLDT